MKTNSFKSIDLASFGLETLNARTCSSPGFECIEMLIFNALFFQKSLFYKLLSLPILFNAVLLNTKFKTMFNSQSIRDKNINIISKIALSLGISIFAIYKQRPILGALASILVLRAFHIFPFIAALGLKRNQENQKMYTRFPRLDHNISLPIYPTELQERPRPQGNPLPYRVVDNPPQTCLEQRTRARHPSPQSGIGFAAPPRDLDSSIARARQPSPQGGLGFAAPPRDLDSSIARAKQPSPQGGLGFAAPPRDLDSSTVRARQPSPQGGLGFAAPPRDLDSAIARARHPSPQSGIGFAAPPGNRDIQQTQLVGQAILHPNHGFTHQCANMNEQQFQQQYQASLFDPHSDQQSFQAYRQNVGFSPSVARERDPMRASLQGGLRPQNIPFDGQVSLERTGRSGGEQFFSQSQNYGTGFSGLPPRSQISDAQYQMTRRAPSNRR